MPVAMELESRGLETAFGDIPYGEVLFKRTQYENAVVLGYAATVNDETHSTEASALKKIAKKLSTYCRKNNLSLVNLPLLGTGAGGMNPLASFEALREVLEKDSVTTYVIYCFTAETFEMLSAQAEAEINAGENESHPRVFISYAGYDKANTRWVQTLAAELRKCGIDARLDQFHLKPGHDLPQWMANEVIMAEKVILVCDTHYMEKANYRKGGVGWETMLIQGDMLAQGDGRAKYIAIIRENEVDKALPIYLRSKYAFNWGKKEQIDPDELKELVMLLYDRNDLPPIGRVPVWIRKVPRNRSN